MYIETKETNVNGEKETRDERTKHGVWSMKREEMENDKEREKESKQTSEQTCTFSFFG